MRTIREMDITLPKSDLVHLLSMASPVVDEKSHLPVLAGIYVCTMGTDQIVVEGTNGHTIIRCSGKAKVNGVGSMVLPLPFEKFAVAMPDGDVRVYLTDSGNAYGAAPHMVYMQSAASPRRFMMHTLPGIDWPREKTNAVTSSLANANDVDVPAEIVALLLRAGVTVSGATPEDAMKPSGTVLLKWSNKEMFVMGCDGARLAIVRRPIEHDGRGEVKILRATGKTLIKLLEANAKAHPICRISSTADGAMMSVEIGSTTLYEKQMPQAVEYEQAIRNNWGTRVRVAREKLMTLVKAVSVESDNEIILHVRKTDMIGGCKVDGTRRDVDEIQMQIDGDDKLGATPMERTIGARPKFLLDAVDSMTCDEVFLCMTEPLQPMIFVPADDAAIRPIDAKHMALVAPIRF